MELLILLALGGLAAGWYFLAGPGAAPAQPPSPALPSGAPDPAAAFQTFLAGIRALGADTTSTPAPPARTDPAFAAYVQKLQQSLAALQMMVQNPPSGPGVPTQATLAQLTILTKAFLAALQGQPAASSGADAAPSADTRAYAIFLARLRSLGARKTIVPPPPPRGTPAFAEYAANVRGVADALTLVGRGASPAALVHKQYAATLAA